MPKIYNFPQASFNKCMEIAEAVDSLGDTCSVEMCATKLGKQSTSGGFSVLLGSAGKFGLIENRKGNLTITDLYKQIKLAYTPNEKRSFLLQSFLMPSVFRDLYDRFKDRELPISFLPKMLVREFGVEENASSRVSGYFVEGMKQFGLLDNSGKLISSEDDKVITENQPINETSVADENQNNSNSANSSNEGYLITIQGPDLKHSFAVKEEEDFEMMEILIRKIKKALKAKEIKSETDNQ